MANFIVMCKVFGGVTGTRQAPLKEDGQVKTFQTREQAQQVADRLLKASGEPYRTARYAYWPEEL